MATEVRYADSVFSGSTSGSADAQGAADGTYTSDVDNVSWTCRWNMQALTDSTVSLTTTTNDQSVTIRTRKDTGTGDPSYVLTVYEGGTLVYTSGSTTVTSTTSQDNTFTWTSSGTNGSNVDMQLAVTAAGGGPSARATVQVDAFTWTASYNPFEGSDFQYWTGSAWAHGKLKKWNGSSWVPALVQKWSGTAWENVL